MPHRRPDVIALGTELRRAGILVDTDGSLNAWFTDSEGSILGLVEGQGDQMT